MFAEALLRLASSLRRLALCSFNIFRAYFRAALLISASSASDSREQALLAAMKPYLSEKRRAKMDRAMQLAHMAKLAQLALSEAGGEDDV